MKQAFLALGISFGCLFGTFANATTYTYVYKGGLSENWSSSSSWSPAGPPPAGSTVNITAGGTLIVDTSANVSGLNLANTLLLMDSTQTLNLAGPATVSSGGEIDLGNGFLFGNTNGQAVITVSAGGGFICSGGSISGRITLGTNSVLNISGPSNPFANLVTFTNYGTVNWGNVDVTNTVETNMYIYNFGLWDAQTNNTIHGSGTFGGTTTTFNNYGTFRKDGGALVGNGSTELDTNTIFNNFGTVDVETGLLEFFNGTSYGGSAFNTVSNSDTGIGNNYIMTGDVTFTGAGTTSGALDGSNAVLHGTLSVSFMTFSNTLTLATNSVLTISPIPGQPVSFAGTVFTNYGTVIWTNVNLYGHSGPQIYNYGLWDATTNCAFYGATNWYSSLPASGTTTFNNYGTFRETGGGGPPIAILAPTMFDGNTSFNNFGLLDMGAGGVALDGSYSLAGGTVNFTIASPIQYGELSIHGNPQLAGGLSVNFTNNYSPNANDTFAMVGAGSYLPETGTFSPLNLPSLPPPLAWQTSYATNYSTFWLTIVSATPPQVSAAMNLNGNTISLSWGGLPGQTYQVQSTTNLLDPNWTNLGSPISGSDDTITVSDVPGGSPQKFYRLELQ